ncbi:DUF4439 domain-containing protein [Actinotalea fermentans]|uniref:DUF4439 domain-containing protein n=1 Tax=Actinotalea fermentans TaxID=43671 RepID=A0A511YVU1_9CELL|nr:DUF4439 domain-containing protein [Actinotalea fermentans]GEN79317.1 hypothetical protein AFE02nite_10510 [Actinotalea fermentans]
MAALVVGALLGGCADVRLETPAPATPTPDAVEQVRDRTARDAVELADLATQAALTAPEAVAPVLGRVAEVAVAHAEAFGGVYEPFPDATPSASAPAAPDVGAGATVAPAPPTPPADAAAVLAALARTAGDARTDADAVADGDLARLLASVWVSRVLLGEALDAAVAGTPDAPADPEAWPDAPAAVVPQTLPPLAEPGDVPALVQSEDAAGLVWEVVAARTGDAVRADAAARAVLHRDRAEAWAVAAGVARTADDPRRVAYDLPPELTVDGAAPEAMLAVAAQVEASLGVVYTSLVAGTQAGGRAVVLDHALDQVRRGLGAGQPVPAFPGLPERA